METEVMNIWMVLGWINDHLLIPITVASIPVITILVKRYLDKKDKIPHNVSNAVEKNKRLDSLCSELLHRLQAQRVNVWLFHNGGYYYTGEPIQKLSIICEKNDDGVEPVIHLFQNQPMAIFQRNLEKLISNDWFSEYNELQYKDSMAVINSLYHIVSSGLFKLKNKEGYFAGILAIGYSHQHAITAGDAELIKEYTTQIEAELAHRHK